MQRRNAFTLVELLVSTALIAFILVILAQVFQTATDSVRILKAQANMQEKLRMTVLTMRADLGSNHFIGNGPKLSDQDLSQGVLPQWGFFRIWNGSPPNGSGPYYWDEGADLDGIHSFRATDHILHFTKLGADGNWYVVAYFLRPTGGLAGTIPLYTFYREQVLVPNTGNTFQQPSLNVTVPSNPATTTPNRLAVLTPTLLNGNSAGTSRPFLDQSNPYGWPKLGQPQFANPTYPTILDSATTLGQSDGAVGDDLVLADVLSFEVQILSPQALAESQFVYLHHPSLDSSRQALPALPPGVPPTQTFYDPTNNPIGPAVYDSWTTTKLNVGTPPTPQVVSPPLAIKITAIQVTLRIWDANTQQVRQLSFAQAM